MTRFILLQVDINLFFFRLSQQKLDFNAILNSFYVPINFQWLHTVDLLTFSKLT